MLGAITSRTRFLLWTVQAWREEILLRKAPPGSGCRPGDRVLNAIVETAAYCVEKVDSMSRLAHERKVVYKKGWIVYMKEWA